MTFDVAPEVYDGFMGRFSAPLADLFTEWVGLPEDGPALDVGCGTGILTAVLARRFGESEVAGVEPSRRFVDFTAARFPQADIRLGTAEDLPFADGRFGVTLAELVVHFMADAAAGSREMVRVTRPGGVVGACVWDISNGRSPQAAFLAAARSETGSTGAPRAGSRKGDLRKLLEGAGCHAVEDGELTVSSAYENFESWWASHTQGIGSAGAALDGLDKAGVERVRTRAAEYWGDGPFTVTATAWVARGTA